MRRLAFIGFLMIAGLFLGALIVSSHHLLGAFMGAVLGGAVAVIVLSFPRNHDFTDSDPWFRD